MAPSGAHAESWRGAGSWAAWAGSLQPWVLSRAKEERQLGSSFPHRPLVKVPLISTLNSLLSPGPSGCCCWEPPPLSECGQGWARALRGTGVQMGGNGWAGAHLARGTQGVGIVLVGGISGRSLFGRHFNVVCFVLRPIMVTVKR